MTLHRKLPSLTRKTAFIVVGVLAAVMVARIAWTYPVFSATYDEGYHIASGVEIYQFGRYQLDLEHPPLSRLALGLLPFLAGTRIQAGQDMVAAGDHVLGDPDSYWTTLTLGRIGNLVFVPVLLFFVYRWSAELFGRLAGVVAVLLVTCSPNVLAHAGLATVDFSITAIMLPAAYYLQAWFREPTLRRAVAAGSWCALALLAKYSAIGFVPAVALLYLVMTFGPRLREWLPLRQAQVLAFVKHAAAFSVVFAGVLWVGFAVNPTPVGDEVFRNYEFLNAYLAPGSWLNWAATQPIVFVRMFFPGLFEGLWEAGMHAMGGHGSQFLLGEIRKSEGWWYYFPVALSFKTALPFLALIFGAGAAFWIDRQRTAWRAAVYVPLGALAILLIGISSELNIGIRHMLPMYPFLAIWGSSVFRQEKQELSWRNPRLSIAGGLVALHVVASLAAHPDYLAFFNKLGEGREHHILTGSNLDWGQDLARLKEYLEEQGIEELHLAYFGVTSPETLGIEGAEPLLPGQRAEGWIAISMSRLQGNRLPPEGPNYFWLWEHAPRAKIGKSIWVYYIEPRGNRPPDTASRNFER